MSTQQHQSYAEAPEQVPLTEIAHMNPLPAHKVPCIWYLKYLRSNYTKTFPKSSLITLWPFGRAGIEVEFVTPTFIISSVKVRMQYAFSHTHLSSKYSPAALTCAVSYTRHESRASYSPTAKWKFISLFSRETTAEIDNVSFTTRFTTINSANILS